MANLDAPMGFRPVANLAAAPYNGGSVRCQIASGDGTATFIGDFVKIAGSASADGYPTVIQAAATDMLYGVVVSFDADPTNLENQYRLASTERYCQVVPATGNQLFIGQSAGTPGVAGVGTLGDIVVGTGDTAYGTSAMELSGTTGTGTAQLRLVSIVNSDDNDPTLANPQVIVQVAEPELGQSKLSVGV
jgi:hypothetical protein